MNLSLADIGVETRARQTALLYRNARVGQAVNAVVATLIACLGYLSRPGIVIVVWWAAAILLVFARVRLVQRYFAAHPAAIESDIWRSAYVRTVAATSLAWLVAAMLIMPGNSDTYRYLMALALAGMVAGAVPVLSAVREAFRIYALPLLIGVAAIVFIGAERPVDWVFGVMTLVLLGGALRSSEMLYDSLSEAIALELEKGLLLRDLDRTATELQRLNASLARRVEEETEKSMIKERLLMDQARHAAMGEMIGNIAHQWRQPLTALGLVIQNLSYDFKVGELSAQTLADYEAKGLRLVEKMTQTIDDFRDFFKPARAKERFNAVGMVRDAVAIMDAALKAHEISVSITGPDDAPMFGYPNEASQVVLNVVTNAKDALLERQVRNARIDIEVAAIGDDIEIVVCDNAGGIADEDLEKIFDPYFTTKETGTGIGLYMTRTIVEKHMGGTIRCENVDEGARFVIRVPQGQGPA